jgi:replicative DNA helicase
MVEVIVGKQRNGPTGTVNLKYVKEYTLFDEYD